MKLRVNEQGPSWPLLPKATSTSLLSFTSTIWTDPSEQTNKWEERQSTPSSLAVSRM